MPKTPYIFSQHTETPALVMAYAITKAGVRWFLDYYPMPVPLNLMALWSGQPCFFMM